MKAMFRIAVALACTTAAVSSYSEPPAAAVYKANCAMCHGAAGDGNTPAGKKFNVPSFSTPTAVNESDATLLSVVKDGKGKMPAWKSKLTDDQVKGVVAFIRTLQKKS